MKGKHFKVLLSIIGLMLSSMSLSSCNKSNLSKGNIKITDTSERVLGFNKTPSRVVCMQAQFGDAWQLAGGSFIGISDDYETYNLDIEGKTIIGTTKAPNYEIILNLNPDFVIYSSKINNEKSVANSLMDLGIRCFDASIDNFQDYLYCLKQFTTLTNRSDLYKTNGTDILDNINSLIGSVPNSNNPKVMFMRVRSNGYDIISAGNIVSDMLKDLKTDNIAPEGTLIDSGLSIEQVIVENPDYIFYVFMGNEVAATATVNEILKREDIKATSAFINDKIYHLDKYLFQYKPNSRWDEAYQYLKDILHD